MSAIEQSGIANRLLRALPEAEFARLAPALELLDLPLGRTLFPAEGEVDAAWFVETGTVSMLARLEEGGLMEVGIVGPEGMAGLPLVFGTGVSPIEALVQVPGRSLRIAGAAFRRALAESPALLPLLLRYAQVFYAQVTQAAACNGNHTLEQRLARWLLMVHDRVMGDELPLTQEFLAQMLGVRRPGVTIAAGILQNAGLIRHRRGHVTILDRDGLENASCECYGAIRRLTARLLGA
ncbi:Crp/Fnr family transcriptional regulator [Siccirubricoccus phaeus]|uniref:Crp/Fnr family transcriptional regulator n=1 Tax=Siccirubricoccus phaeus TaxID=2595053 RepID=UPI0011F2F299|nr:Crp/Fnr family transcriptional regulator [Siccirubricoccus phaeus]